MAFIEISNSGVRIRHSPTALRCQELRLRGPYGNSFRLSVATEELAAGLRPGTGRPGSEGCQVLGMAALTLQEGKGQLCLVCFPWSQKAFVAFLDSFRNIVFVSLPVYGFTQQLLVAF